MYSKDHKLFKAMRRVAISAKSSPVVIRCESASQAKGIQRIWYDCKRTKDAVFDNFKTKRAGKNVTVTSRGDPLQVINDALSNLPSSADVAESLLTKALETRPQDFNGEPTRKRVEADNTAGVLIRKLAHPAMKSAVPPDPSKKPFVRHAGHFVKNDPRLCKDKGLPKGGVDPADRIWSHIVKNVAEHYEENDLRKAISHNLLSYDLIKFNDGLKWLAKENFIVIEGKPGHRRIRSKV